MSQLDANTTELQAILDAVNDLPDVESIPDIIPITQGGTGATDADTALSNLGAAPQSAGQYIVTGTGTMDSSIGIMVYSVTLPQINGTSAPTGTSFIMIPNVSYSGGTGLSVNGSASPAVIGKYANQGDRDNITTASFVSGRPYRLTHDGSIWVAEDMNTAPRVYDTAVTTSGSASAHTATVPGVTSLYNGLNFTIIPSYALATGTSTLNVNSLGAKTVYHRTSNGSITGGYELPSGTPVHVVYSTSMSCWIVDNAVTTLVDNISGVLPIDKGGTGAIGAISARENLGIVPSELSGGFNQCAVVGGYLSEVSFFTSGMSTLDFLAAMPNFSRFQVVGNTTANLSDAPYSYCIYEFMKGSANYITGWAHHVGNGTTSLAHFCANSSASGSWYTVGLTKIT